MARQIARKCTPGIAQHKLCKLCNGGFVTRDRDRYLISEDGRAAIADAKAHPSATINAKKWISMVRCGINAKGHQTRVFNAAIPNKIDAGSLSYEPDMEAFIDALWGV